MNIMLTGLLMLFLLNQSGLVCSKASENPQAKRTSILSQYRDEPRLSPLPALQGPIDAGADSLEYEKDPCVRVHAYEIGSLEEIGGQQKAIHDASHFPCVPADILKPPPQVC